MCRWLGQERGFTGCGKRNHLLQSVFIGTVKPETLSSATRGERDALSREAALYPVENKSPNLTLIMAKPDVGH